MILAYLNISCESSDVVFIDTILTQRTHFFEYKIPHF
jgi:hypothetical protein